ncbi:hypothetical protein HK405_008687, partial [Cladochytrium tenue]
MMESYQHPAGRRSPRHTAAGVDSRTPVISQSEFDDLAEQVDSCAIDNDPLDDGDVAGGIDAHMRAGNSVHDIVSLIVLERNSLRTQNEQLWAIVEKQRVIIQRLNTRLVEMDQIAASSSSQEPQAEEASFVESTSSSIEASSTRIASKHSGADDSAYIGDRNLGNQHAYSDEDGRAED